MRKTTYSNVEALETVASCRAQSHHLRTSIRDADLEITVGVLLLEHNADGLLHVNEETSGTSDTLLVMGHSTRSQMPVVLEGRQRLGVIPMDMRL